MTGAIELLPNNGGRVATALKAIGMNLRAVSADGESLDFTIADLDKTFSQFGFTVTDGQGGLRSTYDILKDLYGAWGDMTDAQKQSITAMVAGKYHANTFAALMSNFENVIRATETALDSEGSALRENAKYLESIEGKINNFKAAWENMSRKLIDSDLVKAIVDAGTAIVKFAGTDAGQFIIQVGLMTGALSLLNAATKTVFGATLIGATKSIADFTKGISGLAQAVKSSPLGTATAIVAGITAIIAVVDSANVSLKEQKEYVQQLQGEYDNLIARKEELSQKSDANSKAELAIVEAEINQKKELLKIETQIAFNREYMSKLVERSNGLNLRQQAESFGKNTGISKEQKEIEDLINEYKKLDEQVKKTNQSHKEYQKTHAEYTKKAEELIKVYKELTDYQKKGINMHGLESVIPILEDLITGYKDLTGEIEKNNEAVEQNKLGFRNKETVISDLMSTLNNYTKHIDILKQAEKELNDTGQITAATFNEITNNKLTQYLEIVNGKLTVNAKALENSATEAKNAAIANLILSNASITAGDKLELMAQAGLIAQGNLNSLRNSAYSAGEEALNMATKFEWSAAKIAKFKAMAAETNAISKYGSWVIKPYDLMAQNDTAERDKALTQLRNELAQISSISIPTISGGSLGGGSTGGGSTRNSGSSSSSGSKKVAEAKKTAEEIAREKYKARIQDLEHALTVNEKKTNSERLHLTLIKKMQQETQKEINRLRKKGVASNDDYLQELIEQQLNYEEKIKELEESRLKRIEETKRSAYNIKISDLEHDLYIYKIKTKNEKDYSDYIIKMQKYTQSEMQRLKKQGAKMDKEYYKELERSFWDYQQELYDIEEERLEKRRKLLEENYKRQKEEYDKMVDAMKKAYEAEVDAYEKQVDAIEEAYEAEKKAHEDLVDSMREEYELRKKLRDEAVAAERKRLEEELAAQEKHYNAMMAAMEMYVDDLLDNADKEIEVLQKQKDELQKLNEEKEESLRLMELEEALARAKQQKIRVYREGKGFVYEEDFQAVSDATKNLEDYKREQVLQKELSRIDAQIKAIDAQIEAWERYKKEWSEVVNHAKKEHERLQIEQELGSTIEQFILNNRLDNLKNFGDTYTKYLNDLVQIQKSFADQINNIEIKYPEIPEPVYPSAPPEPIYPNKPVEPVYPDPPQEPNYDNLNNPYNPYGYLNSDNNNSTIGEIVGGAIGGGIGGNAGISIGSAIGGVIGNTIGQWINDIDSSGGSNTITPSGSPVQRANGKYVGTPPATNPPITRWGYLNGEGYVVTSDGILYAGDLIYEGGKKKGVRYNGNEFRTLLPFSYKPDFKYEKGTTSVPFTQLANINEKGDELIIPPNLNGSLQTLQKGTGVIPANVTENLMKIGNIPYQNFLTQQPEHNENNTFNFDKIVLPNVTDGQSFVNYLSANVRRLAIQSSRKRG